MLLNDEAQLARRAARRTFGLRRLAEFALAHVFFERIVRTHSISGGADRSLVPRPAALETHPFATRRAIARRTHAKVASAVRGKERDATDPSASLAGMTLRSAAGPRE
jgi:hypothetical protein